MRTGTGVPAAGERRFNPNEVVIEVAGRPTPAQVDAMARRHRLNREESQVFNLSGTTMFRWTIPDGRNVASVIRSLEADSSILSVQPNYRYTLAAGADRRRHPIFGREAAAAARA